jgi:hypothetical protein
VSSFGWFPVALLIILVVALPDSEGGVLFGCLVIALLAGQKWSVDGAGLDWSSSRQGLQLAQAVATPEAGV